jgi:DNA-binding transcriptional MerR regulator/methylmalonyl-CoA mutase cobalamin-binding subunit
MAENTVTNKGTYSIGVVERDTGIGRDTLRIWERRYGFPEPGRNDKGERVYSESQLRRLQRVRRLLDQGLRPGKVLPLGEDALRRLEVSLLPEAPQQLDPALQDLVDAVRSADTNKVAFLLQSQYEKQGMQGFVLDTVTPLLSTVGELWAGGRLQIFQEHFLSEQLIRFLNIEIAKLQKTARKPLVLLATLPGEEHTLGLLMVFAMLSSHGVSAVNLGGEVPMDQIAQAVQQFRADVVGVTFSGAYQYTNIRSHLLELRGLIPEDVEIWAGGEGVRRLRKLPMGVTKYSSLKKLPV